MLKEHINTITPTDINLFVEQAERILGPDAKYCVIQEIKDLCINNNIEYYNPDHEYTLEHIVSLVSHEVHPSTILKIICRSLLEQVQ